MKATFFSEVSNQVLFTVFDSKKSAKFNRFRVHHHAELELGCIIGGEGIYYLENERYEARSGDLFLVRPNEQHCVPTITSQELVSFNIHISPYFLWNICADFIDSSRLRALVSASLPIRHRFQGMSAAAEQLRALAAEPEKNRFLIRRAVLDLLMRLTQEMMPLGEVPKNAEISNRLEDIQHAITYIHEHLTEPLTLEEIARTANMSRSHLSTHFKIVTGIPPYEYLLIQRIERAVTLLRESDATILSVAQKCGFDNLANFNRAFKRITGMTPRDYRRGR